MPDQKYEPLTPDRREELKLNAREKPYFDDFSKIVHIADYLVTMLDCGQHDKDEIEEVVSDLKEALWGCVPAQAILELDMDDIMTSSDELEEHFNKPEDKGRVQ